MASNDFRVPMDPLFGAFSVDATVTPPDSEPITTKIIWFEPASTDVPPVSGWGRRDRRTEEWTRRDPIRMGVLRKDEVPVAPRGTEILAPEKLGGPVLGWRVDGNDRTDDDIHEVIVVRVPELDEA